MKILLCCVAGVTSTLFSSKLKDAASRKRVDATVWSASEVAVEYSIGLADVVLVEPQLRSSYEKIKALDPNKPVLLISDEDFKNFNALKIFEMAYDACHK
ncbi:MAG: hypothetical protein HFF36_03340 [Coprobacillus sp.]|nr:hypothetical protein [Coprobacillus sp.]MCI9092809.1 hypothetical protein [Coprobacillus sp.]